MSSTNDVIKLFPLETFIFSVFNASGSSYNALFNSNGTFSLSKLMSGMFALNHIAELDTILTQSALIQTHRITRLVLLVTNCYLDQISAAARSQKQLISLRMSLQETDIYQELLRPIFTEIIKTFHTVLSATIRRKTDRPKCKKIMIHPPTLEGRIYTGTAHDRQSTHT